MSSIKKIIIVYCILLPIMGFSQKSELSPPEASFSAVIVLDMEVSSTWYQNTLGFEILNETHNAERGFKLQNLKHGNVHIELIEIKGTMAPTTLLENEPKGSRVGGFFKFGMKVSDFDQWVSHLTDSKAEMHGEVVIDPISEKRMLIIKDPDGNRIQLFEK